MTEEVKSDAESRNINNDSSNNESDTKASSSALTDEMVELATRDDRVWEKFMSHDRIKQLRDKAKEAEKLQKQIETQEKKKLEEKQEWEKLYQKEKETNEQLQQSLRQTAISSKIQAEASKLGVVDPDAVLALIDKSSIELAEDGTVEGVSEALSALLESKPYLKGEQRAKAIGGSSNQTSTGDNRTFKHSEIQNPEFYSKHEKEILKAISLGLVEDDL